MGETVKLDPHRRGDDPTCRDPSKGPRVVEEYVTFLRAAGIAPRTVRLRRLYLHRLAKESGAGDLLGLKQDQLLQWLAGHVWAPETLKSARASIRGFYEWAVESGKLDRSPASRLPTVRVPLGAPRPAPDHVLATALGRASDRDRLMLMLAAYAGLRRAEVAGLRWACIEWSGLRITGKGGRTRVVPLAPQLRAKLDAEQQRRQRGSWGTGWRYAPDVSSPYVFPGLRGGHISAEAIGETLSKLLGSGWTGHTLRHRFATLAYATERDLLTVQGLLGHSKPETTARYTAPPDGAAKAAVMGTIA